MTNAPTPVKAEWEALWTWHHEQQYLSANKEDYASAEGHKRRAEEIRSYIHGDIAVPAVPPQQPSPTISGSMSGLPPKVPVTSVGG